MFLPAFESGSDCAVDVTVVSPLQQCLLTKAGEEPGAALAFAYNRKMNQSFDACREAGVRFLAAPIETFGGLHPQTISIVGKIGRALAYHSGGPQSDSVSHLFQRIGVLLCKGNSALILSRTPLPSPHPS